ncbi:dual specificity protein phosphatase PHS1 isoform X2 [Aristolochia californica]|uniref:dual specificity protein phosphatase PHS1 isoform X2 n=1 Tax=Aristolochia californica TaxID=171875 RepID=UPI0035D5A621
MAQPHHPQKEAAAIITPLDPNYYNQEVEEEKDVPVTNGYPSANGIPSLPRIPPRMFYLLGDATAGPAYRFAQWLESVRKRSGMFRSSGFPSRQPKLESVASRSLSSAFKSAGEPTLDSCSSSSSEQISEISLWERLGRAAMLDIESNELAWGTLSSLHHTEHSSSAEQSEDEMNKALEVTVNSGGVVFFALFSRPENNDPLRKEAVAVVKVSSSRMATQSERLGYELAKWLGVRTPQARVIHNSSSEWQDIKEAAEKAREVAVSEGDEVGELTCSELLEALEMSRCLLLMNYVHGSPLLETPNAFDTKEAAERTASALGRILLFDLVIRNEDRLPCRQLGWRGNSANLLFADKVAPAQMNSLEEVFDSSLRSFRPRIVQSLQKERRSISVDSKLGAPSADTTSESTDLFLDPHKGTHSSTESQSSNELKSGDPHIVAIDSGVPRRPPAGKRNSDQVNFPRLVELLINSLEYSSNLLYEISGGKMGSPETVEVAQSPDTTAIVNDFRAGFRGALRDLQGFHLFLLTVYQKLDSLLRSFLTITSKTSSGDFDKEENGIESAGPGINYTSPVSKERNTGETHAETGESEVHKAGSRSSSLCRESPEPSSPLSREYWHGKQSRGGGGEPRSLRLTMKLRDFNKYAKVDAELARELDQWNEMLRTDAVRLCQENNFNTGFFEGNDSNSVVDAYELKVRLEHILERVALISDAANTERPSMISSNLFIGGALAARSVHTLQYLGITHILCLCSNEIGQSDSQYPELFVYKNFSIYDHEDAKISSLFGEASDCVEEVERLGKKVLVHCFEGKSRSATVVLAYLMLKKNYTLLEAWNTLKRVHRRAQPNDGFARCLLELDKKLHGKASMEWQHRRPAIKEDFIRERG